MALVLISPNMNLTIPVVGTDPGPDYANQIDNSLNVIDTHNHSPGQGVLINPDGMNINADLSFGVNRATNLLSADFSDQLTPSSNLDSLSVSNKNLYYTDGNGIQIQITSGGQVNGTGVFLRLDGTNSPMTGTFSMGNFKISSLGTPTVSTDAANKSYVDGLISGLSTVYIARNGSNSPSTDISWASHKITNLATPTLSTDAANKAYVDAGDSGNIKTNGSTSPSATINWGNQDLTNVKNLDVNSIFTLGNTDPSAQTFFIDSGTGQMRVNYKYAPFIKTPAFTMPLSNITQGSSQPRLGSISFHWNGAAIVLDLYSGLNTVIQNPSFPGVHAYQVSSSGAQSLSVNNISLVASVLVNQTDIPQAMFVQSGTGGNIFIVDATGAIVTQTATPVFISAITMG